MGDNIDKSFFDAGEDLEPTSEMIARGAVGNGSWSKDRDKALQRAHEAKRLIKVEQNLSRRKAYEERKKDQLEKIADLEDKMLKRAEKIMSDADAEGRALNKNELSFLRLIQTQLKDEKDRGLGKPKQVGEVTHKHGVLHMIAGILPSVDDDE